MKRKRVIVWFRNDLRLHDNEALTDALQAAEEVVPVYIFDTRLFQHHTPSGFPKTGKFRAQFILESVADLRQQLRALGNDLYIRVGLPEEELFDLARQLKSSWVFCNRERTREEVAVQDALEQKLWSVGQEIIYSRGKMLYYTQDLPFPVTHSPDSFTSFRKEVERYVAIREPLPRPEAIPPSSIPLEMGAIPKLEDFGHQPFEIDPRTAIQFVGGETEGLRQLEYYFEGTQLIKEFKETRDYLIGRDYSTKFSAWLSQGCLSPKKIYQAIRNFESRFGKNEGTAALFNSLLWRDYFRLMAKKHGERIFERGGISGEADRNWKDDPQLFKLWQEGRTGVPFIDANMREIAATGYMSNRGRQNTASFLVKDLKVNWQLGAEYFESLLVDYDPASNYGNWNFLAGVGLDKREERHYNILSQAHRYDPNGDYVKLWLPELAGLPADKVHRPDTLSETEQSILHLRLGADYPKAMISTERWAR